MVFGINLFKKKKDIEVGDIVSYEAMGSIEYARVTKVEDDEIWSDNWVTDLKEVDNKKSSSRAVSPEGFCFRSNVIVIKKGLWHKDDLLKFKTKGPESCLADFDKEENLSNTISVVSLDSFFKRNRIKKLDFVKMDIEGAEIRAIEGMKNLMQANKINFAIASYHIVEGKQTCIKLEKMFKEMGYKSNTGYPRHQTTYASK